MGVTRKNTCYEKYIINCKVILCILVMKYVVEVKLKKYMQGVTNILGNEEIT